MAGTVQQSSLANPQAGSQALQHGYDKGALWNGITLSALHAWKHQDKSDLIDVTNVSTQGLQALICGIKRDEFNFSLFFDAAAAPVAVGIVSGIYGVMTFLTGGPPISIPVRISEVGTASQVADAVRVDCSGKYSVM